MNIHYLKKIAGISIGASILSFVALGSSESIAEENFPHHPIRFVIPFPPGGGTDTLARFVAHAMEEDTRQTVVVENKPGGGGAIGISSVANAQPDGYTILIGSINMVTNPYLYKKLAYDKNAIIPLGGLAYAPSVAVTSEKTRFHDMKSLVAYSKNKPGTINYASYGIGSSPHLGTELLSQLTGLDATHIPYQGGGPANNSVLAGQTDLLFSSALPVLSSIQSGRLKALGVASNKRLASLPDVPTLGEQGIDLQTGTWFGFFINTRTPKPVIDKLDDLISQTMNKKSVRDLIAKEGLEIMPAGIEAFTRFVEAEDRRWEKVIHAGKISAD